VTHDSALGGLRVLDLTEHVAGPFCTKLLADYGADVIKVERPDKGDPARGYGPFPADSRHAEKSGVFLYLNTNKRSVTIDIATKHGQLAIKQLARESDIVVESFRPGTLDRYGLSYRELTAVQPRVVLCSISNFGQTGPYRDYAATELVFQAMSGFMVGSGEPEREPVWVPLFLAQQAAGVIAYAHCLAAFRYAGSTGEGLHLDVSIHEAILELQDLMMAAFFYSGSVRRRTGYRRDTNHPANILPCKDGYVPLQVALPQDWKELTKLIGHPEMADDPRFSTGHDRARYADEIDAVLVPWLAQHTSNEVFQQAQERRIPASVLLDAPGVLASPQLQSRAFLSQINHPVAGSYRYPGPPFPMSKSPVGRQRPAPGLGEHNREILANLAGDKLDAIGAPAHDRAVGGVSARPRRLQRLPLAGIRVTDLTQVWAGPKCTQILADLGAEVIKIESPRRTDPARGSTNLLGLERFPNRVRGLQPYDRNGYFNTTNRNKFGINLDLRTPQGADLFARFVSLSHIVVENFSAGVLQRLGFSYDRLREINPSIILVSMSGFGSAGPESTRLAWAETIESMAGLPVLTGYAGGPPLLTFQAPSDPVAGLFGAAAALTALHRQQQTGLGQWVDLAQLEALLTLHVEPLLDYQMNGSLWQRSGNAHRAMAPHGCFSCRDADTWVTIAVPDDAAWQRFKKALGDPEWACDTRYDTAERRLGNRHDLEQRVGLWTGQRSPWQVTEELQRFEIPCGPVLNVAEIASDPHAQSRGLFQEIDHAAVGPYPHYYAASVRLQSETAAARKQAPLFGADNRTVLGSVLGLTEQQIAELEETRVIAPRPLENVLITEGGAS
jgi:crotonobetainyl-CoA:carnitine CoA-transferase CaiB-like acyl-CoA transferase